MCKFSYVSTRDAEPAQFLDGFGSKKAPYMRTIFGSSLVPITNVKATSTSAPVPAPDLSEICRLRLRLRIPGFHRLGRKLSYLKKTLPIIIFPSILNFSRSGPHHSNINCKLTCYAHVQFAGLNQLLHIGKQNTASGVKLSATELEKRKSGICHQISHHQITY